MLRPDEEEAMTEQRRPYAARTPRWHNGSPRLNSNARRHAHDAPVSGGRESEPDYSAGGVPREPALDFHPADIAGLAGLPDPEVLAHAVEDGRGLVTHDLQTMPSHFAAFTMTRQSAGLLLIPQHLPITAAVDDLLLIWSTMEAEAWRNLLWYLPL